MIGLLAYGLGLLIIALISPKGMGMGDVKLAGLIGHGPRLDRPRPRRASRPAWGSCSGEWGPIVALLAGEGRKSAIPYGPFLAAGAVIAVFVGHQIADAYVRTCSA